jgi:flagellar biosynthetic protein FliR
VLHPGTLEAFGLYLVRTSALVLASPLLGSGSAFEGYRIGLIAALSFLLYGATGAPLEEPPPPVEYAILALREVLIGLFLAFTLHAVGLAARVAGEMIGHEMTFNMAQLVDPATGMSSPLVTRLYETFFFLGLLAVDGHHWILRTLASSFVRAPIGELAFDAGATDVALSLFGEMFAAGLTFAAPVVVLLSIVSLVIGLLSRAVPQLNVMEVGFTLRIAVGLVALLVFAPFLAPALESLYAHLVRGLDASLDAIAAVP